MLTDDNTGISPSAGRPGQLPLSTATWWSGRLLCLSLAVSMAVAAADAFLRPEVSWWQYTWPFTPLLLIAWVTLRVLEKRDGRTAEPLR